jgi:hypothetical protein
VNALATRLSPFADRQIGLVGTWARIIGGALAVTLPIALRSFSWIKAGVALVALPSIAAVTAPPSRRSTHASSPRRSTHGTRPAPRWGAR